MIAAVYVLDAEYVSPCELLETLRAQLALLRMRAERGSPVTADSIARAEKLASSIEVSA